VLTHVLRRLFAQAPEELRDVHVHCLFDDRRDAAEAAAMLERLSGRTHRVLTAVAMRHAAGVDTRLSASEVRFRATTPAERVAYCETGEPFDKAGGYGIQGYAAVFIEELQGSYTGVVGLPLFETAALLARCGIDFWLTARAA
jgi:septum formation protein